MIVEPDGVIYAHVVEELAKRVLSVIEIKQSSALEPVHNHSVIFHPVKSIALAKAISVLRQAFMTELESETNVKSSIADFVSKKRDQCFLCVNALDSIIFNFLDNLWP